MRCEIWDSEIMWFKFIILYFFILISAIMEFLSQQILSVVSKVQYNCLGTLKVWVLQYEERQTNWKWKYFNQLFLIKIFPRRLLTPSVPCPVRTRWDTWLSRLPWVSPPSVSLKTGLETRWAMIIIIIIIFIKKSNYFLPNIFLILVSA